jgi:hypothetical protein
MRPGFQARTEEELNQEGRKAGINSEASRNGCAATAGLSNQEMETKRERGALFLAFVRIQSC